MVQFISLLILATAGSAFANPLLSLNSRTVSASGESLEALQNEGLSLPVFALETGGSRFDGLVSYFNAGTTPSIEEFKNKWFSGRCYLKNHPDTPEASILVGALYSDDAPIFEDEPIRVFSLGYPRGRVVPSAFDELNSVEISSIRRGMAGEYARARNTEERDGALVTEMPGTRLDLSFKKSGEYFIEKSVVNLGWTEAGESEWQVGDVFSMCVYWLDVTPSED